MSPHTLTPDEEPRSCVQRERRLDGFGDEILELRAQAWPRAGDTMPGISEVLKCSARPAYAGSSVTIGTLSSGEWTSLEAWPPWRNRLPNGLILLAESRGLVSRVNLLCS